MKIKDLSAEERPRERLLKYGPKTLSNAELLAIILELANKILQKYNLKYLSRLKTSTLKKIFGIGEAKSLSDCILF